MSGKNPSVNEQDDEDGTLVTERDIDEKFGLFQEGTFPGALPDDDQKKAIQHGIPEEQQD